MKSESFFPIAVISTIVSAVIFAIVWIIPVNNKVMTVKAMGWQYTIREIDRYTEDVCSSRTQTVGNRTETKIECRPETKYRTVNQWATSGLYPEAPYWPEARLIWGDYLEYVEAYNFTLSDDGTVYHYSTSNRGQYDRITPGRLCMVSLNWFDRAIGIGGCR